MGNMRNSGRPFRMLGGQLRLVREKHSESLAEVSGAVEIEIDKLEQIERGEQRPSEELLLLLISHFNIGDDDAANLWSMAGYEDPADMASGSLGDQIKQVALVMPMEARIVYTDLVHVMANNYGIVMNFMQTGGPGNQPLAVARVGMSREHAQSVVDLLQQTLRQSKHVGTQRLLPKSAETKRPETDTN